MSILIEKELRKKHRRRWAVASKSRGVEAVKCHESRGVDDIGREVFSTVGQIQLKLNSRHISVERARLPHRSKRSPHRKPQLVAEKWPWR